MSTIIKVLGMGCQKCKAMTRVVQEVIDENNIDAQLEKVDDMLEIMEFNVLSTPALVINNVISIKGRVPSKQEVLDLLKA